MAKTEIICTIGPASNELPVLKEMAKAGMRMARLNFSHGSHADHQATVDAIKELNQAAADEVMILQDLEGFRIRIGSFMKRAGSAFELKSGQIVTLSNQSPGCVDKAIPLDYNGSLQVISEGNSIYIDDGNIALEAIDVSTDLVRCRVVVPGALKEHKGVNIPEARFEFDGMLQKDQQDLLFGIANRVDFVAQSFVRNRQDIIEVRELIADHRFDCKVIAKIENADGIANIDEILDVADGIMVARGDLGVSLPIWEVPVLQKMLIKKCRQKGKIAVTATQMLESMTDNTRPTRAEVSDVANAVLDGSHYVMLSGETAVGKHPVETIKMMNRIIEFTEQAQFSHRGE